MDWKKLLDIKDRSQVKYIVLLGLLGVVLIVSGNIIDNPDSGQTPGKPLEEDKVRASPGYSHKLATELEQVVGLIEGVGRVKISIYLSRGPSYNYEYNQNRTNKITKETDDSGGTREIKEESDREEMVIIKENGREQPVVAREIPPVISGVIVIAEGAGDSQLRSSIARAVSSFLNLPLYKVNVLPHTGRGN